MRATSELGCGCENAGEQRPSFQRHKPWSVSESRLDFLSFEFAFDRSADSRLPKVDDLAKEFKKSITVKALAALSEEKAINVKLFGKNKICKSFHRL